MCACCSLFVLFAFRWRWGGGACVHSAGEVLRNNIKLGSKLGLKARKHVSVQKSTIQQEQKQSCNQQSNLHAHKYNRKHTPPRNGQSTKRTYKHAYKHAYKVQTRIQSTKHRARTNTQSTHKALMLAVCPLTGRWCGSRQDHGANACSGMAPIDCEKPTETLMLAKLLCTIGNAN
jgi:hypothetical protein